MLVTSTPRTTIDDESVFVEGEAGAPIKIGQVILVKANGDNDEVIFTRHIDE